MTHLEPLNRIPFVLSEKAQRLVTVVGETYEHSDTDELSEDMLDVEMPNGLLVSVGWYQGIGDHGAYAVHLSHRGRLLRSRHCETGHRANELAQLFVETYLLVMESSQ